MNVLRAVNIFPKGIKVNHYFSSSTAFFIRTNIPRSVQYFERDKISFDQDNDFDTKNAKAASYERYSAGWSDFPRRGSEARASNARTRPRAALARIPGAAERHRFGERV